MSPSVACRRLPDAPFGAELHGTVAEVLALDAAVLRGWLAEHQLLVFHAELDVAHNRELVSRFGRVLPQGPRVVLHELPPQPQPDVIYLSNEREGGAPANDELAMHHEFAFLPVPVTGLTLYAERVVESSVGTRFVSGTLAHAALPAALRDRIARLQGLFVAQYDLAVRKVAGRHRDRLVDPTFPRAVHPLVVPHPVTGVPVLYVNDTQVDRVLGFGDDESEALLRELWTYLYRPEHSYEHRYRQGDLVVWDNLALQHGRGANDPQAPRTLRRFLFGERTPWEEWPRSPAG